MFLRSDIDPGKPHLSSSDKLQDASLRPFQLTLVDARTRPLDTVRAFQKGGRGCQSTFRGLSPIATCGNPLPNLSSALNLAPRHSVGKIQAHFTPKHASWLNGAEMEVYLLARK